MYQVQCTDIIWIMPQVLINVSCTCTCMTVLLLFNIHVELSFILSLCYCYQVDAAIVRIMKTRRSLPHNVLVSECLQHLRFDIKVNWPNLASVWIHRNHNYFVNWIACYQPFTLVMWIVIYSFSIIVEKFPLRNKFVEASLQYDTLKYKFILLGSFL